MILSIVGYGSPVLKKIAQPIDKDYPELQELIDNMFETMYHADGVGLAAPQIDLSIQLLTIGYRPYDEDTDTYGELIERVMINPEIIEEKGEMHVSYDLWEMCEAESLYSFASIYSAFESMINIYNVLGKNVSDFEGGNRLKEEKVNKSKLELQKLMTEVKKYINDNFYDEEKKCYVRNSVDKKMDISILGAVVPFNVFTPKEKKIQNTIDRINMSIRTYTGGYQRFENDHYMNGNPWVISNLWMTLYYLEKGEKKNAKETFDFVLKTAGRHYLLSEQIDNNTLKPNWVIGLGWSHAMFILVLEKMKQAGQV